MCSTEVGDMRRLCGQSSSLPSVPESPEFPGFPGFPVLPESSRIVQVFLVSLYLRPEMHLVAILENSTLRRDCDLLRQFSLYLTNLFDSML